jgi:hypothetical protein
MGYEGLIFHSYSAKEATLAIKVFTAMARYPLHLSLKAPIRSIKRPRSPEMDNASGSSLVLSKSEITGGFQSL